MLRIFVGSGPIVAWVLLSFSPILAATRPVDCTLIVDGKSYIGGICEFVRVDANGSFSICAEKYWATVVDIENGKGNAYWNEAPYATHAQTHLGEVHRDGGCWSGPKVLICALALDQARRDTIMAARPRGSRISPEHWDSQCVSAGGYPFAPGATLVLDRCDHFWGVHQRVFQLSEDKVLFKDKPELCIQTKSLVGVNDASLVINDCASVAIRWTYDRDRKVIRSNNNLCWDIPHPSSGRKDDTPLALIAHPCEQDSEKNGHFEFDAD